MKDSENEETKAELPAIEAICMSDRRNAHIIRVHGFWFQRDAAQQISRTYIQMEKCDGTLGDYLLSLTQKGLLIEPFEMTEIMIQLLGGLYHCHVQGFTHRDLKLKNGIVSFLHY